MPQVYDVSVRYSRKVQAREYEPIEAEVVLKAQLTEDEDYSAAASKLMIEARNVVHDGIKNKAVGREEKNVERNAEVKAEAKNKRGRPTTKDKANDQAKSDDTFPEESEQSQKNTQEKAQSESNDSTFPDDDNGSDGSSVESFEEPVISIADLREKFSATVKDKSLGISGADLKAVLAQHNVARCDELEDEAERAKVHSELLQLIESKQK